MTAATYHDVNGSNTATNTNRFNESLTYDLRGNISSLQRQGYYATSCGYADIDNLSYTYDVVNNPNRIVSIADNASISQRSHGFNPGSLGTGYTYDVNGNLKTDTYKGISNIAYNYLNLPNLITFSSGNTIEYVYDAAGMKLRKIVKVGATVQYEQDYVGGIEYRKNGTGSKRIESIAHAEGRYLNLNAEISNTLLWQKEYTLKDHLGNARISFTDKNLNGIVDVPSDITQENHYYPFGFNMEGPWKMNDAAARDTRYQYNNKEWNDDFGLNWNDYGARFYDPAIGRFTTSDRFAKKYNQLSPYQYGANNPILFIDVNGDSIDISGLTGNQLERYTASIELLMNSKLFAAYHKALSESTKVYKISAQKGKAGTPTEMGQFFNPTTNEVGVGESAEAYVIAQELFHAFQNDGKFYSEDKPEPESTIETEGDIATIYVMTEASAAYPRFGGWSEDFQLDAYDGIPSLNKVQSSEFQQMFQTAVDKRIQYYKSTGINAPTYTSANRGIKPKALEGAIKLIK